MGFRGLGVDFAAKDNGDAVGQRRSIRDQNGANARPFRTLGDQLAPISGLKRMFTTESPADIVAPPTPGTGAGLRPHRKIPLGLDVDLAAEDNGDAVAPEVRESEWVSERVRE